MADPRRLSSDGRDEGSVGRRRIPIDSPGEDPPASPKPEEVPAYAEPSGGDAEQPSVPPSLEEILIESDTRAEADREVRELTESLLRLQAEFDNYRKRQAREFRRLSSQGRRELIAELLVVLDNCDRAGNHRTMNDESPQELAEGLFRTVDQLRRILLQFGLSELDVRVRDPFDPNIHEAVLAEDVDGLSRDTVLEILQKGYLFDQDLLRPAMVRVGRCGCVPGEPDAVDEPLEIEYEGEGYPAEA